MTHNPERRGEQKEKIIQIASKLLPSFSYESEGIGLKLAEMVEIITTKCGCNLLIPIHYTSQRIAVDILYFVHAWLARL